MLIISPSLTLLKEGGRCHLLFPSLPSPLEAEMELKVIYLKGNDFKKRKEKLSYKMRGVKYDSLS